MNNTSFFSLLPTFMRGVEALRTELVGAALVITFAGLLYHCYRSSLTSNARELFPVLIRAFMISLVIAQLPTWANFLVNAVQGISEDMAVTGNGGNIFLDYKIAIQQKMGSAAATQNFKQNQTNGQAVPSPLPGAGGNTGNGVILTHYAYPGDSTPDSKSHRGIGAFPWDDQPGSLQAGFSAALTASAAAAYHVSPGQTFTVTTTTGQTYNLLYADVAPESDQRVDIYDPQGILQGGNNFSQNVSSINGGAVIAGPDSTGSFMPSPGLNVGDSIMWAITLALSWAGLATMYGMQIVQQMLFYIELALSPLLISFLMIPALSSIARRFFMGFVALCLWPLAWSILDLGTKVFVDLAVNPSGNGALGVVNAAALASGPMSGFGYLICAGIWVIGTTIAAPIFIGYLLGIGAHTATSLVFGATLGMAASRAAYAGSSAVGGYAAIGAATANVISGNNTLTPRTSFARRSSYNAPLQNP